MEGRQETPGTKLEMFSVLTSCYRPANKSHPSVLGVGQPMRDQLGVMLTNQNPMSVVVSQA